MALPLPSRVVICSKNPVKVDAVQQAFSKGLPHLKLDFLGVSSTSGVSDQPWGDVETLTGALNRVASVVGQHAADIVVALEGGVGPALAVPHPLLDDHLSALRRQPYAEAAGSENDPPNCSPSPAHEQVSKAADMHRSGLRSLPSAADRARSHSDSLECFAWAVIRAPGGGVSRARSASFPLPPRLAELVHQGVELGAAEDMLFSRIKSGQGSGTIGRLTLTSVGGQPLVTRQSYYEHMTLMALVPLMNTDQFLGFELNTGVGE